MFLLKIKYGNILSTCQKINNRFSTDRVLCDPNKGRLSKNKEIEIEQGNASRQIRWGNRDIGLIRSQIKHT